MGSGKHVVCRADKERVILRGGATRNDRSRAGALGVVCRGDKERCDLGVCVWGAVCRGALVGWWA